MSPILSNPLISHSNPRRKSGLFSRVARELPSSLPVPDHKQIAGHLMKGHNLLGSSLISRLKLMGRARGSIAIVDTLVLYLSE